MENKAIPLKQNKPDLSLYDGDDQVISTLQMKEYVRDSGKAEFSVITGIPSLNDAIGEFRAGELIVITGATKAGKTLLAQSFTRTFIDQEEAPLWFSYEIPPKQFLENFNMELFYMPKTIKSNDIKWLIERIHEGYLKYNTRIVFIDHLHFLFDMFVMKNPSLHIGGMMRRLKTLAITNNLIIFIIAHTTKNKVDNIEDLSYHNIRDSGMIACESDCALLVHRLGSGDSILKVEFHRRTGVMNKIINLVKVGNVLKEETNQY